VNEGYVFFFGIVFGYALQLMIKCMCIVCDPEMMSLLLTECCSLKAFHHNYKSVGAQSTYAHYAISLSFLRCETLMSPCADKISKSDKAPSLSIS
jgi:hypothetical protein